MFAKLCLLAVALPFVHALTLNAPTDAVSTQSSTVTWTTDANDTVFSLELNHPSLLSRIAVANNVNPGDGQVNVTWPVLLETTGYTLEAVNIGNIDDIFATSPAFNIAPQPSTSSTASSTASGSSTGTAGATTLSVTASASGSTGLVTRSVSSAASGTSAAASSSSSAAPTQINGNGAFSVKSNMGVVALAAAGAILAL